MRHVFDADAHECVRRLAAELAARTELRDQLNAANALVPLGTADLAAPIDDSGLLLAIGMNYRDHLGELNAALPTVPYSFTKSRASVVGPYDAIVRPRSNSQMVDWEGELVVVIGSACYNVTEQEAARCIGGYTIANDVSARDWVDTSFRQSAAMDTIIAWASNLLGKQFPTFCPLGPFLVTSDEISDAGNLGIATRVNGEVVQRSNTSYLIFSSAQLIAYFSQFYRLEPGDMILTGTPSGVGFYSKPQRFLQAGDVVEVEIESLGCLQNTVADQT